jgi:cytochrome oxidase Cu insertion factor (SCO1/SenC/PrrC family)
MKFLNLILATSFMIASQSAISAVDKSSFYSNFEGIKLVDQNNQPVEIEKLNQQKIALFNFIYVNCGTTCPLQTKALNTLMLGLAPEVKEDVVFVSVTLEPVSRDAKNLKRFIKKMAVDETHWMFLGMQMDGLHRLFDQLSLFKADATTDQNKNAKNISKKMLDEHITSLWLIGKDGHIMQRYLGNPMDAARIQREITGLHAMQFGKPIE